MIKLLKSFLIVWVVLSAFSVNASSSWKILRTGLDYKKINYTHGSVHAFKIDPKLYSFGVVKADQFGKGGMTAKEFLKESGSIIAINGGFFTPEYKSLGLLINKGKIVNPIKQTSWWSVFYIRGETPEIVHSGRFSVEAGIDMAIESGPRLLVNGFVPKLKKSYAERSAVCITNDKKVVLVATENIVIEPDVFAEILKSSNKDGGLSCNTALNLDGGSSTQIYADIGDFSLSVAGSKTVANSIVVFPK